MKKLIPYGSGDNGEKSSSYSALLCSASRKASPFTRATLWAIARLRLSLSCVLSWTASWIKTRVRARRNWTELFSIFILDDDILISLTCSYTCNMWTTISNLKTTRLKSQGVKMWDILHFTTDGESKFMRRPNAPNQVFSLFRFSYLLSVQRCWGGRIQLQLHRMISTSSNWPTFLRKNETLVRARTRAKTFQFFFITLIAGFHVDLSFSNVVRI